MGQIAENCTQKSPLTYKWFKIFQKLSFIYLQTCIVSPKTAQDVNVSYNKEFTVHIFI